MHKHLLKIALIFAVLLFPAPASASAKSSPKQTSPVGNDISWPQCNKTLPSDQAFGIVGVNGGLANTTNNCLSSQLLWSAKSTGLVLNQPKTQLYVNTANPGGLGTTSWPNNNIDPVGNIAPNPYGTCDGSDSLPCAWQYGWNRAVEDNFNRFVPAAQSANVSTNTASYIWWLDIETQNTWKTGSSFALSSNVADIEGMTNYLTTAGAVVGIYSTSYQWKQITGTTTSSTLSGLNSWLAGANSQNGAKSNCSLPPLTKNGKVTTTQYVSGALDYDYSCI